MASSTANMTSYYNCEVFLNHRGPDTKDGFVSHLHQSLRLHGIRVFFDREGMRKGDDLTYQIESAIKTASVHVAIFSKNYAKSNWCLNELVLMVESLKLGATIIPVFYGVKPAVLRWTQGENRQTLETQQGQGQTEATDVYAKGLQTLKNKMHNGQRRYGKKTIVKWRRALSIAADINGFELDACNGDEGELVEKIVKHVSGIVKKNPYSVPKYETGLVEKANDFEKKFGKLSPQAQASGKPRVLGIEGQGGVGKTTLAVHLFHKRSSAFRNYTFFSMTQIPATTPLDGLFPELLKGFSRLDLPFKDSSIFKNMSSMDNPPLEKIQGDPSLVILDGVDDVDQGEALLHIKEVIHFKSLILITSRYGNVLESLEVENASIYTLEGLDTIFSQKLFCFHAFNEVAPLRGFEYLVEGFSRVCDGLPLLLKVLGAFLNGNQDRFEWGALLDSFQEMRLPEIERKLEFIYNKLNSQEKRFFMDIACTFEKETTDQVLQIWRDESGWKGLLGFQTLVEKRLVEVDFQNCIKLHHHFKELGKNIEENTGESRPLWPERGITEAVKTERRRKLRICCCNYLALRNRRSGGRSRLTGQGQRRGGPPTRRQE